MNSPLVVPQFDILPTLFSTDRKNQKTNLFVLHETAGSWPGDINWLIGSQIVSVNWYIRRDGKTYQLSLDTTAHAGVCVWEGKGEADGWGGWGWANVLSEGVELEGPDDGTPFTDAQMQALLTLTRWRLATLGISPDRVVRHRDLVQMTTNPKRKRDPMGLDWRAFLKQLYPDHLPLRSEPRCTEDQFTEALKNSPAFPEAKAIYHGVADLGLDPACSLGFFIQESQCGTQASIANLLAQHNYGNLKTGMGRQNGQANGFMAYATWTLGALDHAQRLLDVYDGLWGLYTAERVLPIYSATDEAAYLATVRSTVAKYAAAPDPKCETTLGGSAQDFWTSRAMKTYYDVHGGLLTFGFPLGDAFSAPDLDGETCMYMAFENAYLKFKPSLPVSWQLRPISLQEYRTKFAK